ncbi:MAG: LPXTG cell wall anchor domain-containing protein [Oscillospiraceae bacterium]|nr:LPXTG cell wall anchor domain-containing protein [Oscillospiraceae bacterium]
MNPVTGVDFWGAIVAAGVAFVVLVGLFIWGMIKKKR